MKNTEEFTWKKFLIVLVFDIIAYSLLFRFPFHDMDTGSKPKNECLMSYCHKQAVYGKLWCYDHLSYSAGSSSSSGNTSKSSSSSSSASTGSRSSYSSKTTSGSKTSSSTKKHYYTDPDDYDDPDDFADDAWGVDFDSWDEAYDYWENY